MIIGRDFGCSFDLYDPRVSLESYRVFFGFADRLSGDPPQHRLCFAKWGWSSVRLTQLFIFKGNGSMMDGLATMPSIVTIFSWYIIWVGHCVPCPIDWSGDVLAWP